MRVTASLVAAAAVSLMGVQAAHAQSIDKPQSAPAAAKTQGTTKATTAQARPAAAAANARGSSDAGKAKVEGVSTLRSTPADSKKDGGCGHSMADDA